MNFKWLLVLLLLATPIDAHSYYPLRLDDPKAVYLTPENFPVHADGITDNTEALQSAIDKVQETTGEGIVFVPSGRYRLTTTVYVWGGIRVIGFGPTRPVLVLGENTPGYTDKAQEKYIVFFFGSRLGTRPGGAPATAPAELRKAAGLSQYELARYVGVPQANIAFWERSEKPV